MKTYIQCFHGTWRTARLSLLVLLACALAENICQAATVTWSGAGGDDLWSNPSNWNGGALPAAGDDVVINVPPATTVRMEAGGVTLRSLQCHGSLLIEYGPLSVTSGPSFVDGSFNMNPIQELIADGPTTTFTAHGVVTNLAGIFASAGALISFPNARQVEALLASSYTTATTRWSASGPGSAIEMVNVTNLVIFSYLPSLNASDGGRIDLRGLRSTEGSIRASAANPASLIDLSGLKGLWTPESNWGVSSSLSASDGGTVLIPNVTALDHVDLNLSDSGQIPTVQLRSIIDGRITFTSRTNGLEGLTNISGYISAYDTRLDLTNLTALHATNGDVRLYSAQGSIIDLSRVTNATASSYFALYANAWDRSRIDLRGLRLPIGAFHAEAHGPGSVVDLSGFNGVWEGVGGVTASEGASVLISNVTAMLGITLSLWGDAIVPTSQLRSFVDATITLYSRTNGFERLTNFTGAFHVTDTRLDLTNLTVLDATGGGLSCYADLGSFIDLSNVTNVVASSGYGLSVSASRGSRIDLSGLGSEETPVAATADGAGSLIDLSGLEGLWKPAAYGSLSASADATISIPNITEMEGANITVSGSANLDLSQLCSFTGGSIEFQRRTNGLESLTNFSGSLSAIGARLDLTNLTVLYATNVYYRLYAEQESFINLSNVTSVVFVPGSRLNIEAYQGSRIDLHGLPAPSGPVEVSARDAGSVVDFSGFTGIWSNASLKVWIAASVLISNVTAMEAITLDLATDANVALTQIQSFTSGYLYLQMQTNVFTTLTNFTGAVNCSYDSRAAFPSLTQLSTINYSASFSARDGGVIDLSQVTNAIADTYPLSLSAYYGGRIEMPNMETIAAGSVSAHAEGPDSVIDLSQLTGFFSDNNEGSLRTVNGGAILLNSDAMLLAGVAIDFQSNSGGPLPSFLAPSQSLVLYGQPWRSYRIEARDPSVAGSTWSLYKRMPLTEPLEIIGGRPPKNLMLRVRTFIADPPEVDLRLAATDAVEAILFGVPGRAYRLESSSLSEPIGWQSGPVVTLTNSFFIFPPDNATNDARFYRGREL